MPTKQVSIEDCILLKGVRVNNLKNIDVSIPRDKLVVITGVSGSGKSSLAFDTLFAEGQRRYVESLSSYARQFLGRKSKPEVDNIIGIAPAVAIEQKVNTTNPRSTVGTSTEIYEYLKLLFARIGRTFSPVSGVEVKRHSVSDVVDYIYSCPEGVRLVVYAPLTVTPERGLRQQLEILQQEGFTRLCVGGTIVLIEEFLHTYSEDAVHKDPMLLIDRIVVHHGDDDQYARISESVQTAFFEGRGTCCIMTYADDEEGARRFFSNLFEADGITFEKPNPNFFSFNNPYGACPKCNGYGHTIGIDEALVVPNKTLSIYDDAVVCWKGDKMSEWKSHFIRLSTQYDFPIHKPYCELSKAELDLLWNGRGPFAGINGFFRWVESQSYKIQYRVLLSRYRGRTVCPECHGARLRKDALYVKVGGCNIGELCEMSIEDLHFFLNSLQLTDTEQAITTRIMQELFNRVEYLLDVGLGYLTLSRLSNSLSGGESQRINLATSLGSSLVGSMYILDEPSIGLHPRDTYRLIKVLKQLRDAGNTVIVVEHDEEIMREADYIIDIGPGAGQHGGEVVFVGTYAELMRHAEDERTLTAQYLTGRRQIVLPKHRRKWRDRLTIRGAFCHNLKNVDVEIPLRVFTVVTGVSGSGKTSLIKHVLYDVLSKRLEGHSDYSGQCASIEGDWSAVNAVEMVDQNPIGRSTRSNQATYMKAYDEIRALYAMQPLAKARGYRTGWFSFNVEGGRCETCEGEGEVTIGMQFMADVHIVCEECHGSRFKEETLEVLYHGKHIGDVLNMTVDEAISFFSATQGDLREMVSASGRIVDRLQPLHDVGLGYLKLGQSSSSLSGGEAQRIKLASFMVKGEEVQPRMFIFDEPSTGLHFHDIQKLVVAFDTLLQHGHTVVVIEHHPDIIKMADWVIDMGPEGGANGGRVVFAGTPEQLVQRSASYTAKTLAPKLNHKLN